MGGVRASPALPLTKGVGVKKKCYNVLGGGANSSACNFPIKWQPPLPPPPMINDWSLW